MMVKVMDGGVRVVVCRAQEQYTEYQPVSTFSTSNIAGVSYPLYACMCEEYSACLLMEGNGGSTNLSCLF